MVLKYIRQILLSILSSIVLFSSSVYAQWGPHHHDGTWDQHMWDSMGGGGFGGGFWMFLWPILFLLILVLLGVGLYILFRRNQYGGGDSALEVLREQYARGEITDEEFEKRRLNLKTKE